MISTIKLTNEGYNIGMKQSKTQKRENNGMSSLCGLPKAFLNRKLNPINTSYNKKDQISTSSQDTNSVSLCKIPC